MKVPHNLIYGKGHLMINWEISILFVYSEVLSNQLIYTKNRQAFLFLAFKINGGLHKY